MPYKFLSTSPTFGFYAQEPVNYLKDNGCEVELIPQGKKLSEKDLIEAVKEVDAMVVGIEKITAPVIAAAQKVKIICKHGAGYDNIDVKAATKRGIAVTNAPGTNSDSVADLTIGHFLSLARKLPTANHLVKSGEWPRMVGFEFCGKVLGIIGLGEIGKRVAKRASGFDMKIYACDIVRDDTFAEKWNISYVELDELLSVSDFISQHVPLDDSTRGMIGDREFGIMKKGVYLVNIARGNIVDEKALYKALKEEKVRAAALDVFSSEPPANNPLLNLENVIVSPHMGAYTYEALKNTGMVCAIDIIDMLNGKQPKFIVNPEIIKSMN